MIYSVYWNGLGSSSYFRDQSLYLSTSYSNKMYQDYRKVAVMQKEVKTDYNFLYNPKSWLVEGIKNTVDNSFVFILTPEQYPLFKAWVMYNNLAKYIVLEPNYFITNGNHQSAGRRLKLVVMMTEDHSYRDLFDEEGLVDHTSEGATNAKS